MKPDGGKRGAGSRQLLAETRRWAVTVGGAGRMLVQEAGLEPWAGGGGSGVGGMAAWAERCGSTCGGILQKGLPCCYWQSQQGLA